MTLREQILQAICALLANHTPAAERVFRSRVQALERDELPAIVVKPGEMDSTRLGSGAYRHDQKIKIELYGRGDAADSALDPVIEAAHARLLADATLGGLVHDVYLDEIAEPDFDDNDDSTACVVMSYMTTFTTRQSDLAKPAG